MGSRSMRRHGMKKSSRPKPLPVIGAVVCIVLIAFVVHRLSSTAAFPSLRSAHDVSATDDIFARAFAHHRGNLQVVGQGVVVALLPDDDIGIRHQRFIAKLANGQTLLIAHNIDVGQRIGRLSIGDTVRFSGEYEWNDKGGVVHWTHRDEKGRHVAGWVEVRGQRYE